MNDGGVQPEITAVCVAPRGSSASSFATSASAELGTNTPDRRWKIFADKQFKKQTTVSAGNWCLQCLSVRNIILLLFVLQGLVSLFRTCYQQFRLYLE
jgi:hypothetical protein